MEKSLIRTGLKGAQFAFGDDRAQVAAAQELLAGIGKKVFGKLFKRNTEEEKLEKKFEKVLDERKSLFERVPKSETKSSMFFQKSTGLIKKIKDNFLTKLLMGLLAGLGKIFGMIMAAIKLIATVVLSLVKWIGKILIGGMMKGLRLLCKSGAFRKIKGRLGKLGKMIKKVPKGPALAIAGVAALGIGAFFSGFLKSEGGKSAKEVPKPPEPEEEKPTPEPEEEPDLMQLEPRPTEEGEPEKIPREEPTPAPLESEPTPAPQPTSAPPPPAPPPAPSPAPPPAPAPTPTPAPAPAPAPAKPVPKPERVPPAAEKKGEPTAKPKEEVGGIPGLIIKALKDAGIASSKAHANVLATVKAESNFKVQSENLNYSSADRIQQIFGKRRIPDIEFAQKFVKNPEALANHVYKVTDGNAEPGDGFKYRGRGFIQHTGKNQYAAISKATGADLLGNPDALNSPEIAAKAIPWFFLGYKKMKPEDMENMGKVNKAVGFAGGVEYAAKREESAKQIYAQMQTGGAEQTGEMGQVQGTTLAAAGKTQYDKNKDTKVNVIIASQTNNKRNNVEQRVS